MESLAYIAAAEGRPERAARLLAAAQKMREQQGGVQQPLVFREWQSHGTALRAALDPARFEAVWAQGRAMTRDEAGAYALEPDKRDAPA